MGAVFKCILAAIVVTAAVAAGPPLLPSTTPLPSQTKVELGKAGGFAILTATGITTVPSSAITGNIGCSPIAAIDMTGWSLTKDSKMLHFLSKYVVLHLLVPSVP
jgi:hypothetical protein